MTEAVSTVLQDHMNQICQTLCIGRANFDELVERVQRCEKHQHSDF